MISLAMFAYPSLEEVGVYYVYERRSRVVADAYLVLMYSYYVFN